MYKISIDGYFVFDDITPMEEYKVINPKLSLAINTAGSLSFKLPPSNRGYSIGTRLKSTIKVFKDDVEYWRGRIMTESVDIWGNRDIYCEGYLSYFNDTHQPQAQYANGVTITQFLHNLIDVHDRQVSRPIYPGSNLPNKTFVLGNVTVTDTGQTGQETIYRYTNWESTWDCIQDKLLDKLGGYLYLRKDPNSESEAFILDYLKDPKTPANPQTIEFGKNLLDFTRNFDVSSIRTVIVPFGAALEEEDVEGLTKYLDVKSVNSGSPFVYNDSMVQVWGWIEEVVHWDDVTVAQNLLNKARTYLSTTQFEYMTIELSAIDLHRLNPDISSLEVGYMQHVKSTPHNIDMNMLVSKAVIHLDDPSQDEYTLGTEKRSPSLSDTVQTKIAQNYKKTEEKGNDISNLKQAAVTDVEVMYAQGSSETIAPSSGWSPVAPVHEDGQYMWQKTTVTKANGTTDTSDPTNITGAKGDDGDMGPEGPQGISVVEVETQYYLSTSNQTPTGGSWSASCPAYVSGRYYFTRLKTTFSDSSVEYTDPELDMGLTNANQVAALADSKADDISRGLITNYYTKTETDQNLEVLEGQILSTVSESYVENSTYQTDIDHLQQEIDGAIETFTGSAVPTLSNYPASDWTTTKIKDTHIGDLYMVNSSGGSYAGFYYRFEKNNGVYSWTLLKDSEVTKALQDAAEANERALAAQDAADDVAAYLAQNYMTTQQTNSAIDQKAGEITASVASTYATQATVTTVKNSTIKTDTLHYLATNLDSGVTRSTAGWTTTVQSITSAKPYLWTYHTYTYGDDHTSDTDPIITGRYGTDGTTTTVYDLTVSTAAINKAASASTYNPASITLKSTSKAGSSSPAAYAGRFKIESTTDGSTWTAQYTSSSNESSKTFTVPTNISGLKSLRCSLYLAGGTSTLLDQQTVPIVTDGSKGDTGSKGDKGDKGDTGATGGTGPAGADGKDAYTVILTNENHTFAGSNTAAIAASTECPVIAYKGATQVATTIGTITGQPAGLSTSISNNGTTSAKFTVTVTTSMVTKNGVLNVPVTVDGKTFAMKFTYSLSLKGDTGSQGPQGNKGDKGDKGNTGDTGTGIVDVTPLRYSSSSATAPAAPTSPVTNTGTSAGAWTKGIPALDSTNKYMYTCDQVHYDSTSVGTNGYTWTTVVRDNALTNLTERMSAAELKITDDAIVSTVEESNTFTTVEDFNALSIGGKNLVRNTGTYKDYAIKSASVSILQNEEMLTSDTWYARIAPAAVSWDSIILGPYKHINEIDGKYITVSGEVRINEMPSSPASNDFFMTLCGYASQGSTSRLRNKDLAFSSNILTPGKWVKVSITVSINKDNWAGTGDAPYWTIGLYNHTAKIIDFRYVKVEVGNRATDWSPAPEDAEDYTDDSISAIQVGGENLLRNTKDPILGNASEGAKEDKYIVGSGGAGTGGITILGSSPVSGVIKSFRITGNAASTNRDFQIKVPDFANDSVVANETQWTFSAYVRGINGNATALMRVFGAALRMSVQQTVGTSWTKIEKTFVITAKDTTGVPAFQFGITGAGSIEYVAPKLERGNKATPWSPNSNDYSLGGENLWKDSTTITASGGATVSKDYTGIHGFTVTSSSSSAKTIRFNNVIDTTYELYTVSFKVLATGAATIFCDICDNFNQSFAIPANKLTEVVYTNYTERAINSTYHFVDLAYSENVTLTVKDFKIEKGSTKTAWSPSAIESKSEIQQLSNQIVMKVKSGNVLTSVALSADPDTGSAFKVKADNIDIISNGNIQLTGKSIGIYSTNFQVTAAGAITAKSGVIGGWSIDSEKLYKSGTVSGTDYASYLKPNELKISAGTTGVELEQSVIKSGKIQLIGQTSNVMKNIIIDGSGEESDYGNAYIKVPTLVANDLSLVSGDTFTVGAKLTANKVNGCIFKAGTKIVTATTNTSTAIFTNAQLNTLLGVTNSTNANTVVLASNGDGGAQSAHAEGCTYQNNTWYVTHDRAATAGNMRLNYLVFYWG